MENKMTCPRRIEAHKHNIINEDSWREDNTCSYCGSLNPDLLMENIEKVTITPTDKNYKIYVDGINEFGKFYFQHFSENQQQDFIELMNCEKLNLKYPGRFYILPYFVGLIK